MAFASSPVPTWGSSGSYFSGATCMRGPRSAQTGRTRYARITPRSSLRSSMKAREVTGEELEQMITASARPLVLDAYAPWCGPCQFMLPQLDIVAERYGDAVDIVKLDTEQYPDLASAMRIRGLPTLMFIKNAELKFRMEGALPAEELEKIINYFFFGGPRPGGDAPEPVEDDAN